MEVPKVEEKLQNTTAHSGSAAGAWPQAIVSAIDAFGKIGQAIRISKMDIGPASTLNTRMDLDRSRSSSESSGATDSSSGDIEDDYAMVGSDGAEEEMKQDGVSADLSALPPPSIPGSTASNLESGPSESASNDQTVVRKTKQQRRNEKKREKTKALLNEMKPLKQQQLSQKTQ
jgi:hypothetical protein